MKKTVIIAVAIIVAILVGLKIVTTIIEPRAPIEDGMEPEVVNVLNLI